MKKYIITLFALLAFVGAHAQKGEIIYTDFEPDSTVHFHGNYGIQPPNLYLDIDHDGTDDWYFERVLAPQATFAARFRHDDPNFSPNYQVKYYDVSLGVNIAELNWEIGDYSVSYDYVPNGWPPPHQYPPHFLAIRHQIGEDVYYGWIEVSVEFKEDGTESDVTVYRMAYCTIPDYPFCVGQTDFTTWGMEESEATAFVTVHPNPAKSTFSITGRRLKAAEVLNTLGQRVATAKCEGSQMTVDISGLPAGVYFVNIMDEEGHKCVRKVVKE